MEANNNILIDWKKIETEVSFPIHQDLKDFYSSYRGNIKGIVNFVEAVFFEKTGNKKFDTWISFNRCEGNTKYELYSVKSSENAVKEILWAFEEWTGGNDFGHRAMIGQFDTNIGELLILFNNDTGKIEWIDCGYGYFDNYEDNPNGILANNIQDFLKKISSHLIDSL